MASTAISAQGSTLQIGTTTDGVADTKIGNLVSYSGLDGESSEIDVTNLDSEAKEFVLGLKDNGGFSLEWQIDLDDAGQTAAREADNSGESRPFLLTLPNGKTIGFKGLVKNARSLNGGIDAALTGTCSIKISGGITDGSAV